MTLDEIISNAEFCANEYKKFSEIAPERSLTFKKCEEDHRQLAEWLRDYKRLKEREPCDDCISRQAVLDINESHHGQMPNHLNHQIWQEIKDLPPVNLQPKTGRWIYKQYDGYPECGDYHCSECDKIDNHIPAYCPHCGCAMIEPQERSDEK